MEYPSGRQFVLTAADAQAVITEVGGGIRQLSIAGRDVLDGYGIDDVCDGARGQTLIPWPNRVAGGRYKWDGVEHQLALTEPTAGNAIHGLTRWSNWDLVEITSRIVHLQHRLYPQPGWPFTLRCELRYVLRADRLEVLTRLTNLGPRPCPAAAGAHPYLSAGPATIDGCQLHMRADTILPGDPRGIPTRRKSVDGTQLDFRTPREIGAQKIDLTFTDLHRDADGVAHIELARPDGTTLRLSAGAGYDYLEVFTGDTLAPGRRRRGIAVEPMTSPPNALQSGEALAHLLPNQALELSWSVGRM